MGHKYICGCGKHHCNCQDKFVDLSYAETQPYEDAQTMLGLDACGKIVTVEKPEPELSELDREKLDGLETGSDGNSALYNDGTYKETYTKAQTDSVIQGTKKELTEYVDEKASDIHATLEDAVFYDHLNNIQPRADVVLDRNAQLRARNADGTEYNLVQSTTIGITNFGDGNKLTNLVSSSRPVAQLSGESVTDIHPIAFVEEVTAVQEDLVAFKEDTTNNFSDANTRIDTLSSETETGLQQVNERVDTAETDLSNLRTSNTDAFHTVNESVNELQGRVTVNENKIAVNTSDIATLREDIHAQYKFKGYYQTSAEIQVLPGESGAYAWSAQTGTVWVYDGNSWVDSGDLIPDQTVEAYDGTPLMDGQAHAGSSNEYSRGDHRHPTDTTRAAAADLANYLPIAGNTQTTRMTGDLWLGSGHALRTSDTGNSYIVQDPDLQQTRIVTSGIGGVEIQTTNGTATYNGIEIATVNDVADVSADVTSLSNTVNDIETRVSKNESDITDLQSAIDDAEHFRGYFATTPEITSLPGEQGAFAWNGQTGTVWVYDISVPSWVDSSNPIPSETPYDGLPEMDGTAHAGTSTEFSRGNHVHPTDTSRASLSALNLVSAAVLENADNITENSEQISLLRDRTSSLETTVSSQGTRLDGAEGTISTLQSTVAGNSSDISTLQSTASRNSAAISNLQTTVSGNSTDLSALQSTVSSHGERITTSEGNYSDLKAVVSQNSTDIAVLQHTTGDQADRIAASESSISEIETGLSVAQSDVSVVKSTVSDQGSRLSTAEGQIVTLNGNLSAAQTQLTNYVGSNDSRVSTLETNVYDLQGKTSASESAISTLQSNVATNNSDIQTLTGNVATHTANIATLSTGAALTNDNLTALTSRVSTNESNITANTSDIDRILQQLANTEHFRGYYQTTDEVTAISNPEAGDYAWNGETNTVWLYNGTTWANSGQLLPDVIVAASDALPLVDGEVSAGDSLKYSRGDHRHPTDFSRAAASDLSDLVDTVSSLETDAWGLRQDVDANTAGVSANASAISTLRSNLETVQEDVSDLQTKVSTNQGDIAALENRADILETNVSFAQGDITSIYQSVSSVEGQITTINNTIETLESDIQDVADTVSSLGTDTSGLRQDVDANTAGVSANASAISTLKGTMETVQGEVSDLQEDLTDLKTKVSTNQGDIVALSNRTNTLETNVSGAQEDITSIQQSVNTVQGQITTINNTIDTLENDIQEVADKTPKPSSLSPLMDGVADNGTEEKYARGDHKHPSDVSKANASDVYTQTQIDTLLSGYLPINDATADERFHVNGFYMPNIKQVHGPDSDGVYLDVGPGNYVWGYLRKLDGSNNVELTTLRFESEIYFLKPGQLLMISTNINRPAGDTATVLVYNPGTEFLEPITPLAYCRTDVNGNPELITVHGPVDTNAKIIDSLAGYLPLTGGTVTGDLVARSNLSLEGNSSKLLIYGNAASATMGIGYAVDKGLHLFSDSVYGLTLDTTLLSDGRGGTITLNAPAGVNVTGPLYMDSDIKATSSSSSIYDFANIYGSNIHSANINSTEKITSNFTETKDLVVNNLATYKGNELATVNDIESSVQDLYTKDQVDTMLSGYLPINGITPWERFHISGMYMPTITQGTGTDSNGVYVNIGEGNYMWGYLPKAIDSQSEIVFATLHFVTGNYFLQPGQMLMAPTPSDTFASNGYVSFVVYTFGSGSLSPQAITPVAYCRLDVNGNPELITVHGPVDTNAKIESKINESLSDYLPLTGGTLSGPLILNDDIRFTGYGRKISGNGNSVDFTTGMDITFNDGPLQIHPSSENHDYGDVQVRCTNATFNTTLGGGGKLLYNGEEVATVDKVRNINSVCYVDYDSDKSIANGSKTYPFKTITAALNEGFSKISVIESSGNELINPRTRNISITRIGCPTEVSSVNLTFESIPSHTCYNTIIYAENLRCSFRTPYDQYSVNCKNCVIDTVNVRPNYESYMPSFDFKDCKFIDTITINNVINNRPYYLNINNCEFDTPYADYTYSLKLTGYIGGVITINNSTGLCIRDEHEFGGSNYLITNCVFKTFEGSRAIHIAKSATLIVMNSLSDRNITNSLKPVYIPDGSYAFINFAFNRQNSFINGTDISAQYNL